MSNQEFLTWWVFYGMEEAEEEEKFKRRFGN